MRSLGGWLEKVSVKMKVKMWIDIPQSTFTDTSTLTFILTATFTLPASGANKKSPDTVVLL